MSAKSIYQHEFDGDLPIGKSWIAQSHYDKHIEIVGGTGQGKSTLTEWLMLEIQERNDAGMLLVDPTGDSCDKWIGWLADGFVTRPCYLVDFTGPLLRYNPLHIDKNPKKLASHVSGLFEALSLIQGDATPGQHRQMQRFVTAPLRALIECDLTLADAYTWLTDGAFRRNKLTQYLKRNNLVGMNQAPEWVKEWFRDPSQAKLESTENWFAAFWEHDGLKEMYGGNGF